MLFNYLKGVKDSLQVKAIAVDSNKIQYSDTLTRITDVLPNGFVQKQSLSGLIGIGSNTESAATFAFTLPKTYLDGTLSVTSA